MKMKNENELLADMPIPKAFFRLALPAVAAQLINILYNLVDKMFIGHIPGVGKQALAGVGVTAPVILAISAFAALVSMGGGAEGIYFYGKRRYGAGRKGYGKLHMDADCIVRGADRNYVRIWKNNFAIVWCKR